MSLLQVVYLDPQCDRLVWLLDVLDDFSVSFVLCFMNRHLLGEGDGDEVDQFGSYQVKHPPVACQIGEHSDEGNFVS